MPSERSLNLLYLTDADLDAICVLRCPVIPVPYIIMIAVRIIMIDHYEYACDWKICIIVVYCPHFAVRNYDIW